MSNVDGVEVVEISIKRGRHFTRGFAVFWPRKRKWLDLSGTWCAGEPKPFSTFHEAHAARMGLIGIAEAEQYRDVARQRSSQGSSPCLASAIPTSIAAFTSLLQCFVAALACLTLVGDTLSKEAAASRDEFDS